jgi:ubiquinone/menaquinone biosynthesis C-methylase UbiE
MAHEFEFDEENRKFDKALLEARKMLANRVEGGPFNEFNVRGKLYDLAHQLAPEARRGEIDTIKEWLAPARGERSLDVAAGSGFLTKYLLAWTSVPPVAIDPSYSQLVALRRNAPETIVVHAYPDDARAMKGFRDGHFDFATSLGGIHHVVNQRAMFANVSRVLRKGGRFVFADVCSDTLVSRHFDEVVARKCLTGHTASWLSPARIRELVKGLPLVPRRVEIVTLYMRFSSERQMYLFFKGLHAYDLSQEEVLRDLGGVLGLSNVDGEVRLNWPLLFVNLEKA